MLLSDYTRNLLVHRPRKTTIKAVSEATGISYWWLNDFLACKQTHVDCDNVQRLYEYLTGDTDRFAFDAPAIAAA